MISTATLAVFFSTGIVGGIPCPPLPLDAVLDLGNAVAHTNEDARNNSIYPSYYPEIRLYLRRGGAVAWGCAKNIDRRGGGQ